MSADTYLMLPSSYVPTKLVLLSLSTFLRLTPRPPPRSVGDNVNLSPSGECICGDLYLGDPVWDTDAASYTNLICTLAPCPFGSVGSVAGVTGRDGESGCDVLPGYMGKAVRLDVSPWVESSIEAVTWYVL